MKNLELKLLACLINKDADKYENGADGVTLIINGLVVSGIIIPHKVYLAQSQNATLKHFYDLAEKTIENEDADLDMDDPKNFNRLFLKQARYFVGSQMLPSNGKNFAVVNIDSIDGFNMGALAPE
ncbi:hypothetical protein [Acinetobacter ursingii]|uniref:hypothetical protein n=1 Tax=Acinetobacter ursingii TaxID=108980 RepID=UPI00300A21B2